jgi:hypothetical protein
MTFLTREAKHYYFYLLGRNDSEQLDYSTLRTAILNKFEWSPARHQYLRQLLSRIRYRNPEKIFDYCQEFREIELQLTSMEFMEKLERFIKPLPTDCAMFIYNLPQLYVEEDMEVVYRAARQWSMSYVMANRHSDGHGKPSARNHSKRPRFTAVGLMPEPKREKEEEREEDSLNMMDVSKMKCYNCQRIGHLA